jgi:hypothetical protein|tara:strand:- start:115 stop:405 length:291 start_codon:yes stop_codon:yes gene_type:complete
MKFDILALSSKLNKVDTELKKIDLESDIEDNIETKIKKYGTFLDSKKEMAQLYILFIFFGLHGDIISQMPRAMLRSIPREKFQPPSKYKLNEYDPD